MQCGKKGGRGEGDREREGLARDSNTHTHMHRHGILTEKNAVFFSFFYDTDGEEPGGI
jgi:hypothetical protein